MNVLKLALKNIKSNGFRSLIIFLCVAGVAGFFLATTLLIRGAEYSLNRGIDRLGADIIVVPEGAELKVETALLMGKPTKVWMSRDMVDKIAAVPGVEKVSPQIYLSSLFGASCCSVSEMFMVVFDPATDFAIRPWLERQLGRELRPMEVIGGTYIFVPPGDKAIKLYGCELTLRGNLEPTGTGIDQTMFMTVETAKELARQSVTTAEQALEIPDGSISTVMAKVDPGSDPHKVTLAILANVLGVTPIESPSLFGSYRNQMNGLLWGFFVIMFAVWVLSAVLVGLVFSMAANERRREIAVLRALGATKRFIFSSIVTEAAIIALAAGVTGITASAFGFFFFRDFIAASLKVPFLFPSAATSAVLFGGGIAFSLATVMLAAYFPAQRISRQEPAIAMRE